MFALIALFKEIKTSYYIGSKAQADIKSVFGDWRRRLERAGNVVAYYAGNTNAHKPAHFVSIKKINTFGDTIAVSIDKSHSVNVKSGDVCKEVYRIARKRGHLNKEGFAPLVYFLTTPEFDTISQRQMLADKARQLLEKGDYKGICMMFAPLKELRKNAIIWESADILYMLGLACSKLAVTLNIKAQEKERLFQAGRYRNYCEAFFKRSASLEPENSRHATALAYRYYSNVHELMRPGERRDQALLEQIDKAHEWLSRALEIYPESIRNHYRKGKLIIQKQAPYLLFGQRAFGTREAELLREIREVGEEHLATAIMLYETQTDEKVKRRNRLEYAKALFVLGSYYIDDAYLPVHEYYIRLIAGAKPLQNILSISILNIKSAIDYLEKCFFAETDISIDKLDIVQLSEKNKEWTRSPIEKLYRLGCAHSALCFVARVNKNKDELKTNTNKALYYLEAAIRVARASWDRKRNTWHISEKIAWTHIHNGQYAKAAALLLNAKSGYIINTRALALLLLGGVEPATEVKAALAKAAQDKNNLSLGLSKLLLAYVRKQKGETALPLPNTLSIKNGRIAELLGLLPPNSACAYVDDAT